MKKEHLLLNELVIALDSTGLDWRQIMEDHIKKMESQPGIHLKKIYNLEFLKIVMWNFETDRELLNLKNLVEEYRSS